MCVDDGAMIDGAELALNAWFRAHAAHLLGAPARDAVETLNAAGFWATVVQAASHPKAGPKSRVELVVAPSGSVRAVQLV